MTRPLTSKELAAIDSGNIPERLPNGLRKNDGELSEFGEQVIQWRRDASFYFNRCEMLLHQMQGQFAQFMVVCQLLEKEEQRKNESEGVQGQCLHQTRHEAK